MLSNAEYLLALPTLKLLCAKTDRYWLLLVRCLRLAQKNTKHTFEFDNQESRLHTTNYRLL